MNALEDIASLAETRALDEVGRMLDDGMLVADAQGIIISANSTAVRLLGEGLIGKSLTEVIPAEDVVDLVAGRGTERSLVHSPQSSVTMEFNVRIRRMDDGLITALLLDMTLQRNLEKVRRDFVANVSHELRSPLTSLAGFIETILVNDVRDWPTQQRFLRIMEEEAGRMSRLIDDLLSLSRVEVDEHIVPDETVPLLEVVKSVIASLEARAEQRQMRIVLADNRPNAGSRLVMNGYADEINEIFHNLIENATKYGFEGTDIKVDILSQQAGTVIISVTNTGLGLAIVKHIVNRHRGTMQVTSSAEGVTRFTVSLPVLKTA